MSHSTKINVTHIHGQCHKHHTSTSGVSHRVFVRQNPACMQQGCSDSHRTQDPISEIRHSLQQRRGYTYTQPRRSPNAPLRRACAASRQPLPHPYTCGRTDSRLCGPPCTPTPAFTTTTPHQLGETWGGTGWHGMVRPPRSVYHHRATGAALGLPRIQQPWGYLRGSITDRTSGVGVCVLGTLAGQSCAVYASHGCCAWSLSGALSLGVGVFATHLRTPTDANRNRG